MESIYFVLFAAAITSVAWSAELQSINPTNKVSFTNTDKTMVSSINAMGSRTMKNYNKAVGFGAAPPDYFTITPPTEEEKELQVQLDNLNADLKKAEDKKATQLYNTQQRIQLEEAKINSNEYVQILSLQRRIKDKNLMKQKTSELRNQFKEAKEVRKKVFGMELFNLKRFLKNFYGEEDIKKEIEIIENKLYGPPILRRAKILTEPDYFKTPSAEDEDGQ